MLAVIDVETTGFSAYRFDRIVEIAIVVLDHLGSTKLEFSTLVNPERDVGPTSVHGLRASDLIQAPKFGEIMPILLASLEGTTVLIGHNLRFDVSFLEAEFGRLGVSFPECQQICTMHLAGGGSLPKACSQLGIEFKGVAHSAMADARATARLFNLLAGDEPGLTRQLFEAPPTRWPVYPSTSASLLRREDLANVKRNDRPSYIQRLIPKMDQEPSQSVNHGALLAYSTLLAQVLEDREVDENEGQALVELATKWSISRKSIETIHRDFLNRIQVAALLDGMVTEEERADIHKVARLLGLPTHDLDKSLDDASLHLQELVLRVAQIDFSATDALVGKTVCFTGECDFLFNGEPLSRETLMELASAKGLVPVRAVTKKLDILVAADTLSQSGKASKARAYGIAIWSNEDFFRSLRISVR